VHLVDPFARLSQRATPRSTYPAEDGAVSAFRLEKGGDMDSVHESGEHEEVIVHWSSSWRTQGVAGTLGFESSLSMKMLKKGAAEIYDTTTYKCIVVMVVRHEGASQKGNPACQFSCLRRADYSIEA
jgi:hypothetical protein